MAIKPSVPEIITVNSEDLQATIRDLLPSQNGFGSELQATNVITPIIDLTATAEGSVLRQDLQTSLAFGSQTAFNAINSTVVLANSPGFYRIFGQATITSTGSAGGLATFTMTDGLSVKTIYTIALRVSANSNTAVSPLLDFNVWLAAGESISAVSSDASLTLGGSIRQIADSSGNLVSPTGYPL